MRRTMLFLPGNSPNILLNADILGSDSIILDLEDAVSPEEKDSARILVRNALRDMGFQNCEIIVRVNPIGSGMWMDDLDAIIPCRPNCILPAKINCAEDIHQFSEYIAKVERENGIEEGSTLLIPLLETAMGVEHAYEIATADKRVTALFIGCEDLTADMRCVRTEEGTEIFYSRCRVVSAARAAGIDAYDTPFTDINDDEGLTKDAEFAKGLGFTGKACISPRQIKIVNTVFSPSKADVEYAHEVFEAIRIGKEQGKGAVSLRGKMIDKPIVDRAAYVLEMDRLINGGGREHE